MLARLREELAGSKALNAAMQDFLRAWSAVSERDNPATLLDQAGLEWFAELNRGLRDPLDDEAFKRRIRETTAQLRQLAREIVATACAGHPHLPAGPVLALLDASPSGQASLLFDTAA
jgi:biopolymer transport protein ExbB/TolQ